jgi:hypothetical protein
VVTPHKLKIVLFDLYFERHRTVSQLLVESGPPPPKTTLATFRDIYSRHGWEGQSGQAPEKARRQSPTQEPIFTVPHLAYCTMYHLLGVDSHIVETILRTHAPEFSLRDTLRHFCEVHECDLESTFPSLKNETPSGPVPTILVTKHTQPLVIGEEPDTKRRRFPTTEQVGRILPVFLLPHLLALFPDCCKRVTNILAECEHLEKQLWLFAPVHRHQNYVRQQIRALYINRNHLAFLFQQGLSLSQCEHDLYERALATLVETQRTEAALEDGRRREMRELLTSMSVNK